MRRWVCLNVWFNLRNLGWRANSLPIHGNYIASHKWVEYENFGFGGEINCTDLDPEGSDDGAERLGQHVEQAAHRGDVPREHLREGDAGIHVTARGRACGEDGQRENEPLEDGDVKHGAAVPCFQNGNGG